MSFFAGLATFGSKTVGPNFRVSKIHSREGMFIINTVSKEGKPDDLVISEPGEPKIAEATPPAPYEGSATFTLTSPKTSTWKGDLAVDLPGLGRVSLAGKDFRSVLCEEFRCTKTGSVFAQIIH